MIEDWSQLTRIYERLYCFDRETLRNMNPTDPILETLTNNTIVFVLDGEFGNCKFEGGHVTLHRKILEPASDCCVVGWQERLGKKVAEKLKGASMKNKHNWQPPPHIDKYICVIPAGFWLCGEWRDGNKVRDYRMFGSFPGKIFDRDQTFFAYFWDLVECGLKCGLKRQHPSTCKCTFCPRLVPENIDPALLGEISLGSVYQCNILINIDWKHASTASNGGRTTEGMARKMVTIRTRATPENIDPVLLGEISLGSVYQRNILINIDWKYDSTTSNSG